jgi:hypothetical protein
VTVLFGYLLAFAAGGTVGAALYARAHTRAAAAQVEDLHLKVEVLHESSDDLVDRLRSADRVLAEKDRLVQWLTGAVHDQAARLRRAPTFRTPHAGERL